MTYFDLRRHTRSISTCSPERQRWFDLRRSGLGASTVVAVNGSEMAAVGGKRSLNHLVGAGENRGRDG